MQDTREHLKRKLGDKLLVEPEQHNMFDKRSFGSSSKDRSCSPIRSGSYERRFGVDPVELIKRLSDKKNVDNESFLLINANEVLAKDGIHGRIAEVGIGFGTGRHTSTRRAEHYSKKGMPDSDRKILSILKDPNSKRPTNTSQVKERAKLNITASENKPAR